MSKLKSVLILLLLAIIIDQHVAAERILAVFPTVSRSHYISGSALIRALAAKGHNITVITPFEEKKLPNLRVIPIPGALTNKYLSGFMENEKLMGKMLPMKILADFHDSGIESCRLVYESPGVQWLLKSSDERFDLIIAEMFLSEALLGLVEHFKAPVVAFSSFGSTSWHTELVGASIPPSQVPHLFLPFSSYMNFWERLVNVVGHAAYLIFYHNIYLPRQEILRQNYFPNAQRSLAELRKNVSLVILNQHFSLSTPRQYPPNIIEAGGMHIDGKQQPLPDDLKDILDNASEGAVFFSLGTNFKSKDISADKFRAIVQTLASLKQKVLWKFENASLSDIPSNVFIRSWYPQNDVLAHPNLKLFITHGGLLSTTETIYYGKPIVGVPLFGDQPLNMKLAERMGIGRKVDYVSLNEENFKAAVHDVLHNPKYTQKVQHISRIYRDQPLTPIETAVFWTEYVIRHNGASHFHTPAVEQNIWQYHSIDTIAVIISILAFILGGLIWFFAVLFRLLLSGKKKVKTN